MADPQHTPELDGFDTFTVRLYRASMGLAAAAVAVAAVVAGTGRDPLPALVLTGLVTAVSVTNLHLYDKRIRWLIVAMGTWGPAIGAAGLVLAPEQPLVLVFGSGLSLAALSAVALKENFCFRVPGARWVPAWLATGILAVAVGQLPLAAVCLGVGALLVGALFVAKVRMPLSHDIGDRTRYQI